MQNVALMGAVGASVANGYTNYNQGNMIQSMEQEVEKVKYIQETTPPAVASAAASTVDLSPIEGKELIFIYLSHEDISPIGIKRFYS